jgi:hypothetical protein
LQTEHLLTTAKKIHFTIGEHLIRVLQYSIDIIRGDIGVTNNHIIARDLPATIKIRKRFAGVAGAIIT